MSLLHSFINHLNDEEIEKIRAIQLPARERNVLETIINFRHRELPEKSELTSAIEISTQHFDKISSVLLDKCYEAFAPERGLALLDFFTMKSLHKHFSHEVLLQEKQLLKNPPENIFYAEEFYMRCFLLSQAFSSKYYDEKFAQKLGEKYLAARIKPVKDDETYVDVKLLLTRIIMESVRGVQYSRSDVILKELERHEKLLNGSRHALALYSHYQGFSSYYTYFTDAETNARKILEYLLKAMEVCKEFPDILQTGQKTWTQCKIAESYYAASDFQKAYDLYSELFNSGELEKQKRFYHTTKFVQICIILDKFSQAEQLLKENFGVFVASREQTLTTMAAISYAKLYLACGEIEKAKKYIGLGFELNTKNQYIQYEIELHNLQNTYFFLKEDWEIAEDFARRNLKFLNSKGFTLENTTYGYFYKMILTFINTRLHRGRFPENLENMFEKYQSSYYAVYGKLLKIMREKAESF